MAGSHLRLVPKQRGAVGGRKMRFPLTLMRWGKRGRNYLGWLVWAASAVAGMACSKSYDLGNEPFTKVEVDATNPTWANGIGELMKAKCANCHVSSPGKFVPADSPRSLDLSTEAEVKKWLCRIKKRVFDYSEAPATKPMPPDFGTPFSEEEKAALRKYIELDGSCTTTPDVVETPLLYADMKPIVDANCVICHPGASTIDFSDLSKIKPLRTAMIDSIEKGRMPQFNPTWKDSQEGKDLLTWLKGGKDLTN